MAAQRSPVEADRAITELQAQVDRLKKEAMADQIGMVSKQLETLSKDVEGLKRTLDDAKRPAAAPAEAWRALGVVGAIFVVAWTLVSWRREAARENEAILNAAVKGAPTSEQAKIDEELAARITLVDEMMQETQKKLRRSLSLSGQTTRFVSPADQPGGPAKPRGHDQ